MMAAKIAVALWAAVGAFIGGFAAVAAIKILKRR